MFKLKPMLSLKPQLDKQHLERKQSNVHITVYKTWTLGPFYFLSHWWLEFHTANQTFQNGSEEMHTTTPQRNINKPSCLFGSERKRERFLTT